MEDAPHIPETYSADKTDKKVETKADKKSDKTKAAQSVAETLFSKSAEKSSDATATPPKKEETFWERVGGEKATPDVEAPTVAEQTPDEAIALREATQEHVADRQAEVQVEVAQADPNSVEAVAAASDAALLSHAQEQLHAAEDMAPATPTEAFDAAYEQTAHDLDEAIEASHSAEVPPTAAEYTAPNPVEAVLDPPPTPLPIPPEYRAPAPAAAASAEQQPTTPSFEDSERQRLLSNEYSYRRGRSDGFFTGGLFGYLYGRRRGRKKAEKQFKPVREGLENRLKQVTEKLTRREQDIRTLAEQKLEQAPQPVQYDRVVEKLAPQPSMPLTAETMPLPAATAEAPVPAKQPTAAELALSRSEYAGIVPFNTPTEQLSSNELKAIAEKVVVDHVSLKEMYEAQQFDEKGLRRIVNEFLRGGDVQRAITNEVIRKDKAFELDPRLRHQAAASDSVSGGGTGAAGTIEGQYRELPSDSGQLAGQTVPTQKRLPELGQDAMRDLKRRQVVSVAGVTAVVLIAIILALVVTS